MKYLPPDDPNEQRQNKRLDREVAGYGFKLRWANWPTEKEDGHFVARSTDPNRNQSLIATSPNDLLLLAREASK